MTDFTEKLSTYSNVELLRIIENAQHYEPSVVDVARKVLAERHLSEQELLDAKAELFAEKQRQQERDQWKTDVAGLFEKWSDRTEAAARPDGEGGQSADRIIRNICVLFCGVFLVSLCSHAGFFWYMFTSEYATWDLSILAILLPLVVIAAAVWLFYKRKSSGWTLMAVFLAYTATGALASILMTLKMSQSVSSGFDHIYSQSASLLSFTTLVFYGGMLWAVCDPKVREVYNVSSQYAYKAIGIAAAVTMFGWLLLVIYSIR